MTPSTASLPGQEHSSRIDSGVGGLSAESGSPPIGAKMKHGTNLGPVDGRRGGIVAFSPFWSPRQIKTRLASGSTLFFNNSFDFKQQIRPADIGPQIKHRYLRS